MILYILIPLVLLLYHIKYTKMFSIRSKLNKNNFAFFYVRGIIFKRAKIIQTLNPSDPIVIYFDELEEALVYFMSIFINHNHNIKKEGNQNV